MHTHPVFEDFDLSFVSFTVPSLPSTDTPNAPEAVRISRCGDISWKKPALDGGRKITSYRLQLRWTTTSNRSGRSLLRRQASTALSVPSAADAQGRTQYRRLEQELRLAKDERLDVISVCVRANNSQREGPCSALATVSGDYFIEGNLWLVRG